MEAQSGETLWMDTLNFPLGSYDSPVGYKGKVFIGRNDWSEPANNGLLALDAQTGNILWQKLGIQIVDRSSKPISKGNETIFIASSDTLYCLKITDGEEVWKKAGKYTNLLIDYGDKNLYASRQDSAKLEVLTLNSGALQWSLNFSNDKGIPQSMSYTINNSKEYLVLAPGYSYSNDENNFYCVDITSKSILWSSSQIGYTGNKSAPVIYGDMVVAGTQKTSNDTLQNIVAFGLLDGQIKWEQPARSGGATNSPYVLVLNNQVFFESSVNNLFAAVSADLVSGDTLWTTRPKYLNPWPLTWGSPLVYDNKLYLAKDGEGVFCYDAGEVNQSWPMVGGNIHATNSYYEPLLIGVKNEVAGIPELYLLDQNYPNPFNPSTNIKYHIPFESHVSLKVYDILGKEVAHLVNKNHQPGSYSVEFNAKNLSSGVYIYTIKAGDFLQSRKMLVMK